MSEKVVRSREKAAVASTRPRRLMTAASTIARAHASTTSVDGYTGPSPNRSTRRKGSGTDHAPTPTRPWSCHSQPMNRNRAPEMNTTVDACSTVTSAVSRRLVDPTRSREHPVEDGGHLLLHPLGDVAVHVEDERRRRVAEPLGYNARMRARLQQERRSRVPQIVEADARKVCAVE